MNWIFERNHLQHDFEDEISIFGYKFVLVLRTVYTFESGGEI